MKNHLGGADSAPLGLDRVKLKIFIFMFMNISGNVAQKQKSIDLYFVEPQGIRGDKKIFAIKSNN